MPKTVANHGGHSSGFELGTMRSDGSESSLVKLSPGLMIGRYRLEKKLGQGGFGVVFEATDTHLGRQVAIKFADVRETSNVLAIENSLAEASTISKLNHENIVQIYHTESSHDLFYIIMELVRGQNLASLIKSRHRLPIDLTLQIAKQIATALQVMHQQEIYHRDIKPANILLNEKNEVKLADFGLALSEASPAWTWKIVAGTRSHMAPEQINGETFRIDGRTDIWALGVVIYQMACGRLPFSSKDRNRLFDRILKAEHKPLQQHDSSIPQELDDLCNRCLQKRIPDRFKSAADLLAALDAVTAKMAHRSAEKAGLERRPLETPKGLETTAELARRPEPSAEKDHDSQAGDSSIHGAQQSNSADSSADSEQSVSTRRVLRESVAVQIVPRGLKPFLAEDHSYFLRLLPGPLDRNGLPLSVSFWKHWIENDADAAENRIGVIYGSSGCGKSSFIKAGLLPTIDAAWQTVFVDFTVGSAVEKLLVKLQREFPESREAKDLPSAMSLIRRNRHRVLLVFDQFEQYLLDRRLDLSHPIVQALRQCDGENLKSVLLIRDEFWSEISQLMNWTETPLGDGDNSMNLPLLTGQQANQTLWALGVAHGRLPELRSQLSRDQIRFVEQAVSQLEEEGMIICVRLTIFAELMKQKEWTTANLKQLGGIDGAAVQFLRSQLTGKAAPMPNRQHAKICQAILRCLIPSGDYGLKANAASKQDLIARLPEYSRHEIDQATVVLCQSLHFVSESRSTDDESVVFSLAHDYLVKPVRQYLIEEDGKTRAGRAALRLQQLATQYQRDSSKQNLPTLLEGFWLRGFTNPQQRSEPEHSLLAAHLRRAAIVSSVVALLVLTTISGFLYLNKSNQVEQRKVARAMVKEFMTIEPDRLENSLETIKANPVVDQATVSRILAANASQERRKILLQAMFSHAATPEQLATALTELEDAEIKIWIEEMADSELLESVANYAAVLDDCPPVLLRLLFDRRVSVCDSILAGYEESPAKYYEFMRLIRGDDFRIDEQINNYRCDVAIALQLTKQFEETDALDEATERRLQDYLTSSSILIATTAWALLEELKPSTDSQQWLPENSEQLKVELAETDSPIVMVRLPERRVRSGSEPNTPLLPSRATSWVASKPIPRAIYNAWLNSQNGIEKKAGKPGENADDENLDSTFMFRSGEAVSRSERTAVFEVCNFLSRRAGYEPVYVLDSSQDLAGEDSLVIDPSLEVRLKVSADGFRLPFVSEMLVVRTTGRADVFDRFVTGQNEVLGTWIKRFRENEAHNAHQMLERTGELPFANGFFEAFATFGAVAHETGGSLSTLTFSPFGSQGLMSYWKYRAATKELPLYHLRVCRGPIDTGWLGQAAP